MITLRDPLDGAKVLMSIPCPAHMTGEQRRRLEQTALSFLGLLNELKATLPEAEYDERMTELIPAMARTFDVMIAG